MSDFLVTLIGMIILGTGLFSVMGSLAMLKFGNNKKQGIATLVVGVIFVSIFAVLVQDDGLLDDVVLWESVIGFIGAALGSLAGFAMFIMAIMKS